MKFNTPKIAEAFEEHFWIGLLGSRRFNIDLFRGE